MMSITKQFEPRCKAIKARSPEWVYGFYFRYTDEAGKIQHRVINSGNEVIDVLPNSICVATNILDAENNELYLHDLVSTHNGLTAEVVWVPSGGAFALQYEGVEDVEWLEQDFIIKCNICKSGNRLESEV